MRKGVTQTNEPKVKNVDDYTEGFRYKRWHRLYMSRKDGGRGIASYVHCFDASTQEPENYIKKSQERLIAAVDNSIGNISTERKNKEIILSFVICLAGLNREDTEMTWRRRY